jgi:hypothetical protein
MKKKNLTLIISGIIFVILGVAVLITAYAIQGADIIGWFGSKWGITVLIFLGIYLLVIIALIIKDRIDRL